MLTYICENKEWIFSGIGITAVMMLAGVVKLINHHIQTHRLKNTPPWMFKYAYKETDYWPWNFEIVEPDQAFLENCFIKNHALLLKKLKSTLNANSFLVWIDIDKFTQINKMFGRECGDIVIHTILMIIASVINEFDAKVKVYHAKNRDEFYIIGSGETQTFLIETLISAIQRYEWSKIAPNMLVTCSAGIALHKDNSIDTLKRARVSLNLIKSKGGNGIGPEIIRLHPYELIRLDVS